MDMLTLTGYGSDQWLYLNIEQGIYSLSWLAKSVYYQIKKYH